MKDFSQKAQCDKHQQCNYKIGGIVENVIINKKLISTNSVIKKIKMEMPKMEMPKIKTMRYLGNKTNLLEFINDVIYKYKEKHNLNPTIIDGFGGTGSVTQHFNKIGFNVISNDINDYAYKLCYSRNNITKEDLCFKGLEMNIEQVLDTLNKSKKKGFIYKNYSPNSDIKHDRKYFTNNNAEIIDGIRCQIQQWFDNKQITYKEGQP
jgi:adenine-specific DNA-methyltransferase